MAEQKGLLICPTVATPLHIGPAGAAVTVETWRQMLKCEKLQPKRR